MSASACTIVMATFNGGRYIGEQLDSIDRQLLRPRRLIISDDGSTDDTKEIVASFARRTSIDVVLVDGPQQGYAENFWCAAKLADTEFVAWADQDDVWYPQKLRRCIEVLNETSADLVSHAALVVDSSLRPLGRRFPDYRKTRVLGALQGDPFTVPWGFASMFRRELLEEVQWDGRPRSHQRPHPVGHDHAVGLVAFAFHRRVQLAEPLADHRLHASNVSGTHHVSVLARVPTALSTTAEDYARLSSCAEGYADYFLAVSPNGDKAATEYYRAAAGRAQLRAQLRIAETAPQRILSLIASVRQGNYRAKSRGGFGLPALANDGTALALSMGKARLSGQKLPR